MGSIFLTACRKEIIPAPVPVIAEACILQTANPAGHSYPKDSVVDYQCNGKFCGLMPLSMKNYWVYLDSMYTDGVFIKAQYDTLRYTDTYKSLNDGIVWWESNMSVGLPDKMYVNDSAFFKIEDRLFVPGIVDAKKDYSLFPGDSIHYLASFDDAAAQGRSLKLQSTLSVPAGNFSDVIYFEKNARSYRLDQVYLVPGIGVAKYITQKAPMGSREIKLQQVSTLVKYHFE
jgi:hypothetical protein